MFKPGEKVVCVDDEKPFTPLEINKVYTVYYAEDWYVKIYEFKDLRYKFSSKRFKSSIKEERKKKIKNIWKSLE